MAFVTVDGEVSRLNRTGDGFGVKESWETRDGKNGFRYWSVFPDGPTGVNVGDRVRVTGGLSTKVGDPRVGSDGVARQYVEHTVNRARLEAPGGSGGPNTPPQASSSAGSNIGAQNGAQDARDAWATPGFDQSPF